MTITHGHVCEGPTWKASSFARFWEPGTEEWAREKLYLPQGSHISAADYDRLRITPYREADGPTPGNLLTNDGLIRIFAQLKNGTKSWSASSAGSGFTGLAVGTGTTAALVTDIDLTGGSKSYRACDDTYPLLYGQVHPITSVALTQGQILFAATWTSAEAVFTWNEYAALVPTGSASTVSAASAASTLAGYGGAGAYKLLNHRANAGLGDKASGSPASLYLLVTIV